MTKKEFQILKINNRLKAIESRGKAEPNCGVIKKLNRQLRNLEK